MATTCEVRLLGALAVELDGAPLRNTAWRSPHDADLVALLALEPTHRLARDGICHQLWPDLAPGAADRQLQRAVKGVRKALKDKRAVTTEGPYLRLWPHGTLRVDVLNFVAAARHARTDASRHAALTLYGGDLLPERPESSWTEPMRTRARLMHLELMRDPDAPGPEFIDLRTATAVHATA